MKMKESVKAVGFCLALLCLCSAGLAEEKKAGISHWKMTVRQGKAGLTADDPHSGKWCLAVECEGASKQLSISQQVQVNQTQPLPIEVRYWGRVKGTPANLTLRIAFTDGTATWWSPKLTTQEKIQDNKWKMVTALYIPKKPITRVYFICVPSYKQAGTAWFDDVSLCVSEGIDGWKQGRFGKNLLKNPGFEEGTPPNPPGKEGL